MQSANCVEPPRSIGQLSDRSKKREHVYLLIFFGGLRFKVKIYLNWFVEGRKILGGPLKLPKCYHFVGHSFDRHFKAGGPPRVFHIEPEFVDAVKDSVIDTFDDVTTRPSSLLKVPEFVVITLVFTLKNGTKATFPIRVQRTWFSYSLFVSFLIKDGKTFSFCKGDEYITILGANKHQVKAPFVKDKIEAANYFILDKCADAMLDPSSPVQMPEYVNIPIVFTSRYGTEISLSICVERKWFKGSFMPFVTNYGKTFSFHEGDVHITILYANGSRIAQFLPREIEEAQNGIMEQIREHQQNELQHQRAEDTGCCTGCYEIPCQCCEKGHQHSEFRRDVYKYAVRGPEGSGFDSDDSMC